jgi:hypothetical protein
MFTLLSAPARAHKYVSIVFTCTILILLSNVSVAQYNAKKKPAAKDSLSFKSRFEIGAAGGLSLNEFTKGQPQTGISTGYTAGFLINYKLYKQFGLQLEANFLQQGGQLISFRDDTQIGLPESFETKNVENGSYNLNSIEIPLLVNYTFKIKQSWKPALYIGCSYAYTYNVTENYQKTGNLLPGEEIIATATDSRNATSSFNNSRFNFIAGANVQLPLCSRLKLLLDFRYLTGLTEATENYSYVNKIAFGSGISSNSFISRIGVIMPLK